jgi:hypothetical protein
MFRLLNRTEVIDLTDGRVLVGKQTYEVYKPHRSINLIGLVTQFSEYSKRFKPFP